MTPLANDPIKKLSMNAAVPGRLCRDPKYADFYQDVLKADGKITKIFSKGYIVPFDTKPPPAIAKNNKSCFRNKSFAIQELRRLE